MRDLVSNAIKNAGVSSASQGPVVPGCEVVRAGGGRLEASPLLSSGKRTATPHLRSQLYGAAILLVTTVLWASGGPTSKYLFLLPAPPSAALLTACISVVTALFLVVGLLGAAMDSGARAAANMTPAADEEADEVNAEALLHSGVHAVGAAGGASGAVYAAARAAAHGQDMERAGEQQLAQSQPPHLQVATHRTRGGPAGQGEVSPSAEERLLNVALGGNGGAGERSAGLADAGGSGPRDPRVGVRGPSLDGTSAPTSSIGGSGDPAHRSGGGHHRRSSGGGGGWRMRVLTARAASLPAAGLELGVYNVMAAALGAWGMQRISATRSAFLAQATSLITPLLVWLSGGQVGPVVWAACCCGSLGGAMVALDNVYGAASAAAAAADPASGTDEVPRRLLDGLVGYGSSAALQASGGDQAVAAAAGVFTRALQPTTTAWEWEGGLLSRQTMGAGYVLLSCVFWGLGTVRLGVHSARFKPLHLASAAAVTYACLSLLWLLAEIFGSPNAGLSDFLELGLLLRNHVTAALLLWAGLGPGALSSYLQVLGQQTVPPAQAQVLFSSTPLWSALIAQLLLPGEAMGPLAWAGGAAMLGASLLASLWQ